MSTDTTTPKTYQAYDLTSRQVIVGQTSLPSWWFGEMAHLLTEADAELVQFVEPRPNSETPIDLNQVEDTYVIIANAVYTLVSAKDVVARYYESPAAESENDDQNREIIEDDSASLQARRRPSVFLSIGSTLTIAFMFVVGLTGTALGHPNNAVRVNQALAFVIAYGSVLPSVGVALLRSGVNLDDLDMKVWRRPRVIINLVIFGFGVQIALCLLSLLVSLMMIK